MGKTRDLIQKIRDTKETFHTKMGTIKDRNCMDLTEAENPMDGGAWQVAVHGVAKSWIRLSDFTFMHWRRKWQPTPVFLPGESQGWGTWWAAIYGVTQSRTRLK